MKKTVVVFLIAFAAILTRAQMPTNLPVLSPRPPWSAVVNVIDESGLPVAGAKVEIGYYVQPPPGRTEAGEAKGIASSDDFLGSTHGGWRFNTNYSSLTPAQAALLPDSQLRTNAFFDFSSPSFPPDVALQGNLGSAYAYTYRNRILSDAIPATSWAVGSHAVTNLDIRFGEARNFDMNLLYQNGWPEGRFDTGEHNSNWYHSDYREIAYTFTYPLFNKWVTLGDLK